MTPDQVKDEAARTREMLIRDELSSVLTTVRDTLVAHPDWTWMDIKDVEMYDELARRLQKLGWSAAVVKPKWWQIFKPTRLRVSGWAK